MSGDDWVCRPWESSWGSPEVSEQILGKVTGEISTEWAKCCAKRVRRMRDELRRAFVGLCSADQEAKRDWLVDWLLAALISRENVLLLGPPGVAKSEIAILTFKLLGLSSPVVDETPMESPNSLCDKPHQVEKENSEWKEQSLDPLHFRSWWREREKSERRTQKYFHYLLSRFTQPEELFGPIEIGLLRQGILARVNFGLLTGPGVRAAFLDEIFKASSSILNTLLTLTNERIYFNWGGMVKSDLLMFIGASNEMPGGFATGATRFGSGGEDFQTLHVFVDRFPIRLSVPLASWDVGQDLTESNLSRAFDIAIKREADLFRSGKKLEYDMSEMPSINDILLLGRYCFQHESGGPEAFAFEKALLKKFRNAFIHIAADLQQENTSLIMDRITWTISPRKLKALYKIALAHALVRDDDFESNAKVVSKLDEQELRVFNLIWDTPVKRNDLLNRVKADIKEFWE